MTPVREAVLAALLLAAVMTFGDFVWSAMHLPHRMAYGITHGAVMCLVLGLVIGWRAGRVVPGALAGPVIGVLAALVFYALAPWLRYSAMFPAWMFFWILFAFLQQRLSQRSSAGHAAVHGIAAALVSGLAFYLISDVWARRGEPNYMLNFFAWSFAFFPGFVALFFAERKRAG